jgi:hypothetical protein
MVCQLIFAPRKWKLFSPLYHFPANERKGGISQYDKESALDNKAASPYWEDISQTKETAS